MSVGWRTRNVSCVPERLQFRDQVDTVALRVLNQAFQLFGSKCISMGHKIGNRREAHRTPLVVSQAELKGIQLPVRTELYHPLVVVHGLRNAAGVYHKPAYFPSDRGFPRI